jgi:hypothetical protein
MPDVTKPATMLHAHHHQSSSPAFLPCIAAWRCLNASASPPAMLPLLSRGPASTLLLAPLPEYPLSRAALPRAGFFAAGRFAGGVGAGGLARSPPFAAGRAGGAGGGAGLCTISSTYADGAHPEADLSSRCASHHPDNKLAICRAYTYVCRILIRTIAFLLRHQDHLTLLQAELALGLSCKVVQSSIRRLFGLRRRCSGRWRRRRSHRRGRLIASMAGTIR